MNTKRPTEDEDVPRGRRIVRHPDPKITDWDAELAEMVEQHSVRFGRFS